MKPLWAAAVVVLALLVPAAAPATAGTAARTAPPAAAALPAVDMEATVKAAQIDPRRADSTLTPGAKASVLLVEKALQARGLLAAQWVDGYFGTTTVTAYTRFQQSLGLQRPGRERPAGTDVAHEARREPLHRDPGAHARHPGRRRRRARRHPHAGDAHRGRATAGPHAAAEPGLVQRRRRPVVSRHPRRRRGRRHLRRRHRQRGPPGDREGVASGRLRAWLRNPSQGDWPFHIHAAAISDTDLSSQAQHQTGDYVLGRNGLANRGADDGPRIPIRTWEEYQRV